MAEAGVYCYVGIALYSQMSSWWSYSFVFIMFFIIIIGRIIAVFSVFYSSRLCCKRKTINFNELCFITYAGMIRGAIAFALVLGIPTSTVDPETGYPVANPNSNTKGIPYCPNTSEYT